MDWLALGVGGMIGCGIAAVIDRIYWRGLGPKVGQGENPFKADMTALRGRFDDAQEKLARTRLETEELQAQVTALSSSDNAGLVRELAEAKSMIRELQTYSGQQEADLRRQLAEAQAQASSYAGVPSDVVQRLADAEAELEGYRSIEEITKLEMAELRRKLAAAPTENMIALPSPELSILKDEILAKDVRIGELQAQLSAAGPGTDGTAKDEQLRALTVQLESSREMIRRLEDRLFEAKSDVNHDEDIYLKRAEAAEGRLHQLQGEVDFLRQELEDTKFNLNSREKEIANATLMADLENLQRLADNATAAKLELQAQLTAANAKLAEIDSMPTHTLLIGDLQSQLEEANDKLKTAMIASDRAAFQDRQISALETDLRESRTASAQLQAELTEFKEKDAKKSALKQDIEELTLKLEEREVQIASLMQSVAGQDALRNDIADLNARNEGLTKEVDEFRRRVSESDNEAAKIVELESKLLAATRDLAELTQLRASLEHHRTALGRVISEVNSLKDGITPVAAPSTAPAVSHGPIPAPSSEAPAPGLLKRDPLEQINGIGFVYERKLWDAGILTYADLANATPDEIRKAIMPEPWQHIEPTEWILEAAQRVAGD